MSGDTKRNVLGVLVDAVSRKDAVGAVLTAAAERRRLSVSALAVHGVMTGVLDPEHRFRLNQLDLVVPDGQPVRWALNALHRTALPERVYGPDLMFDVCAGAAERGLSVYLYGSTVETLDALQHNLRARLPRLVIAGARPSRFRRLTPAEHREVVDEVRASGAAVVFVGLGCPRQEVWAYEYQHDLALPVIAVGAAFDFHAGRLKRAPAPLQRAGLEWCFRLLQEPRRLWRRYLLLNPHYAGLVALQMLGWREFDSASCVRPLNDVGCG